MAEQTFTMRREAENYEWIIENGKLFKNNKVNKFLFKFTINCLTDNEITPFKSIALSCLIENVGSSNLKH